jgi:hypothetical protein
MPPPPPPPPPDAVELLLLLLAEEVFCFGEGIGDEGSSFAGMVVALLPETAVKLGRTPTPTPMIPLF